MNILITGAAGFIGFHIAKRLIQENHIVFGIDSLNSYYSTRLKISRLKELGIENPFEESVQKGQESFQFIQLDLCNKSALNRLFVEQKFDVVINLAAQAGVRYSLENPQAYIDSNIQGFQNLLEASRAYPPKHLIFASSSSVYGLNQEMPFATHHHTDHPVSLYAATKKANEMMAHTYAHLFGIPCSGLRFFTVYGPWGRPDMAYFSFTEKILRGEPIDVFNNGDLMRDFTYVDDIVEGISRLIPVVPKGNSSFDLQNPNPSESTAPYKLYNIGNNTPVKLMDFIEALEDALGKKAIKNYKPMQAGDVYATFADVDSLTQACGFKPTTSIQEGLKKFVGWYKEFYQN